MAHVIAGLNTHTDTLAGSDVAETNWVAQSSVVAAYVRIDIETGSSTAVASWTGNTILAEAIADGFSALASEVVVTAIWQGVAAAGVQPFVTAEFVWYICSDLAAPCATTAHVWDPDNSLDKAAMATTLFPGLNPNADTDAILTLYDDVNVTTTLSLTTQLADTCYPPDVCYPSTSIGDVAAFLADGGAVAAALTGATALATSWGQDVEVTGATASEVIPPPPPPEELQEDVDPCGAGTNLTLTNGTIEFSGDVCAFDCECTWVIRCPPRAVNEHGVIQYYDDQGVTLYFDRFSTESNYDVVTMYDGYDAETLQLTTPMSGSVGPQGTISSTSTGMVVRFTADSSEAEVNDFKATYSCGLGAGPVAINVTILPHTDAVAHTTAHQSYTIDEPHEEPLAKDLYSAFYEMSRRVNSSLYSETFLSTLLYTTPPVDNFTVLGPEYQCESRYNVYINDNTVCDALVTSGMSCSLYFCADCRYSNYCDSACGYCEDVAFISRRFVTPTYGTYAPRTDLYSKAQTAFLPWNTTSAPWTVTTYRRALSESALSCNAQAPPVKGSAGDCTTSVSSGSTCQPVCNIGYLVSGVSSCEDGVLTAATCSLHDAAIRATMILDIGQDNILENHIQMGISALLSGVAMSRITLVGIDEGFVDNATVTIGIAAASLPDETPAVEAVALLAVDLLGPAVTLTIGSAAPAAGPQVVVITYPTCLDTDVGTAGSQAFVQNGCEAGTDLLTGATLSAAVCSTAACASSSCCAVPWYHAMGISVGDLPAAAILSTAIAEVDVAMPNIVANEVMVVYGTGRIDIVVIDEFPRSSSSVEKNQTVDATVSLGITGALDAQSLLTEVVPKVLADSVTYTTTRAHRYSREPFEMVRSYDRSEYTASVATFEQTTRIEVGVYTHLCASCVATAISLCSEATIGTGDAAADQASCEAAAACTYTAEDSGNGVAESCIASDLATCSNVAIDAAESACTSGVESATSGCTYTSETCAPDDFGHSKMMGEASTVQMTDAITVLLDVSTDAGLVSVSIDSIRGAHIRTACFDHPTGWGDIFGVGCAAHVTDDLCRADGLSDLAGTCDRATGPPAACGPGHGNGWDPTWGTIQANANSNGEHALGSCCGCGGGRFEYSSGAAFTLTLTTNYDAASTLNSTGFTSSLSAALTAAASGGSLGSDGILMSTSHDATNVVLALRVLADRSADMAGREDVAELQALLTYNFHNSARLLGYIQESGAASAASALFTSTVDEVDIVRPPSCCSCECVEKMQDCDDTWVPALWAGDGICDEGQVSTDATIMPSRIIGDVDGVVANLQCDKFDNDLGDCDGSEWAVCDAVKEDTCSSHVTIDGYSGTVMSLLGCTDKNAPNFDVNARLDDGSCESWTVLVTGCMDSDAFNYNPAANVEDGYCIARVYGCIDATAYNFVEVANTNDGSCVPTLRGCMDPESLNYAAGANSDDDSCDRDPCLIDLDDCHVNTCDDATMTTATTCVDSCDSPAGAVDADSCGVCDDGSLMIATACAAATPPGVWTAATWTARVWTTATCFHSNVPGNYDNVLIETNLRFYDMSANCVVLYNGTTICGPNEYEVNIFQYTFVYTRVPYYRAYGVNETLGEHNHTKL